MITLTVIKGLSEVSLNDTWGQPKCHIRDFFGHFLNKILPQKALKILRSYFFNEKQHYTKGEVYGTLSPLSCHMGKEGV